MNYLIDENITPELCTIFEKNDLIAHHINSFKSNKNHRIIDDQIRRLSLKKGYVVVTKDDDFVKSYVDRKVPEKMVYLYDLSDKRLMLERFEATILLINRLIISHDFIEVNRTELRLPFSE